ncbi:MAG TPA: hypothetical protein VIJ01_19765 [Candidatus Angelobacter sp.]
MAFIPPEIGFRVKNRFTYSEIHTFMARMVPGSDRNVKDLLIFSF